MKVKMNIGQLIEALSKFPKEMLVVVDGYEGGYDDINIREKMIQESYLGESYLGKYEDEWKDGKLIDTLTKAVILSREDE